jgi:hypothetical protein
MSRSFTDTGELVLHSNEEGEAQVHIKGFQGDLWFTQLEIAKLFQISKQDSNSLINSIFSDGELQELSVVKSVMTSVDDGESCKTTLYNLDMILAVGYRVRSPRGTQFRRWATSVLKEYLVKGFAMDDARLKAPGEHDYFDELLERIRDIRASEKRFYQKIKDIYTTAVDYDSKSSAAQLFFKKVQNKMLWAITGYTAAELIASRSDPKVDHLGLSSWKGAIVRKGDVTVAKNYLKADQLDELNRIVGMYLDYAEFQAKSRKTTTMAQWEEKLDAFLSFNERDVLKNAGKIKADVAEKLTLDRFSQYETARLESDREKADVEDIAEIEKIGKDLEKK